MAEQKTIKGRKLVWRDEPFTVNNPLSAWQGLLQARGLHEFDPFFSPKLSDLPDPDEMQDMERAAEERVAQAVLNQEHIHIFGDFDADGVSGMAILTEALKAAGARVTSSIPHRSDDGHGIGVEPVREAVKLDFDLIVTDHHLPERAPERSSGEGPKETLPNAFALLSLLDRVAIATVADVMDLVGVNRVLVYHGLQRLNGAGSAQGSNGPSVGIQALKKIARVKKSVSVETIGFYLAPRINAAGRMRHGEEAMRMLSTSDEDEAMALAESLDETNKQRRLVEADVFKAAEFKLGNSDVLAVYDEAWHAGVVGLAAGRLARKHGRPTAVGFITPEGQVHISLQGRPGFHVGNLLNDCAEYLEGFGGHAGAGGGTVKADSWNGFLAAFGEAVAEQSEHTGLAEHLQKFEPVGQGNAAATWLIQNVHIAENRPLKGSIVSLLGQLKLDEYRGNGAVQFVVEGLLVSE